MPSSPPLSVRAGVELPSVPPALQPDGVSGPAAAGLAVHALAISSMEASGSAIRVRNRFASYGWKRFLL
jgi:hypothetical protein